VKGRISNLLYWTILKFNLECRSPPPKEKERTKYNDYWYIKKPSVAITTEGSDVEVDWIWFTQEKPKYKKVTDYYVTYELIKYWNIIYEKMLLDMGIKGQKNTLIWEQE
jgi:hypothetical protein